MTTSKTDQQIENLRKLLADVYKPEGVEIWLTSKNRGLGDHTPMELLDQGKYEEVVAAVNRLIAGSM